MEDLITVPFFNQSPSWEGHLIVCLFADREFKQIATAGATTAAVTEKVWGEYVSVVCQILAKRVTKMSETWTKEIKIYFI